MDRLTDNHYTGGGYYLKCSGVGKCAEHCEECEKLEEAVNRLAAYEESGLTPEEVKDMAENAETRLLTWFESKYGFPVGELMGLCEANAEGRIIILPCKAGEYWRDWNGDRVRIETVSFRKTGRALSSTDMVTYSYVDEEDESAVNWIYFKGHFTREEAEAALKGGESDA